MISDPPLITVITPLYNYGHFIAEAIESVLAQSWPNLEMVVVDDGSTDQGPELVESYADRGVRLIRQRRNGFGVARALNTAIHEARGQFISWLSADDYYLPDKLEKNYQGFLRQKQQDPAIAALHSEALAELVDPAFGHRAPLPQEEVERQFREQGRVRWRAGISDYPPDELEYMSLWWNQVNGCTTFVPKATYSALGPFRETWPLAQDYEMWVRMMLMGHHWGFLAEPLSVTRFHAINSGQYDDKVPAEAALVQRWLSEVIEPAQLRRVLLSRGHAGGPADHHLEFARVFTRLQIQDYAWWHYLRYSQLGGPLPPADLQAFEPLQARYGQLHALPLNSLGDPARFLLAVGPRGRTWRLQAVLTHYLTAFGPDDRVELALWLEPEQAVTLRAGIEETLAQVQEFLGVTATPNIHWLPAQTLAEAVSGADFVIPLASNDPAEIEASLLALLSRRPILYLADAPYLQRALAWARGAKAAGLDPDARILSLDPPAWPVRYARPGESLAFDGETWTQHCQSPNQPALPGMQQVLAPADLRRLPVLSDPAVRVEAASELARTQLQRRGWQTVLSALPTTAAAVISGMHLPESPYILLVYGDTTGWQLGLGALLALAPRLQALPGICLYLPPELSVSQEAIEDELVAEAEASGADESLDLELTLVPGQDLSQSERVELFARATLLLLPWTRWESGQPEWLLAKATNTPAIVQGLDPVLPTSWQVLTPFEQLQVISPDAPLPVTYEYLQELLHRQLQP